MLKKLGLFTFHKLLKQHIERLTGLPCYDDVPKDAEPPFYILEVVGKTQNNTKTLYREEIQTWVHIIAPDFVGSTAVYQLIQKLEEALTVSVQIPEEFTLLDQQCSDMQVIKTDPTDEKHAVIECRFVICYGYRTKL